MSASERSQSDSQPQSQPENSIPAAIDMDKQTVGEAFSSLQRLLNYSATLPETLRSAGAYASELVRESANWIVPSAFRNSHSYSVFVQQMLDYLSKDLAGAWRGEAGQKPDSDRSESELQEEQWEQIFLARKTVGGLLDMTALATFHVSPLTVLAVYSEMAYGSHTIIQLLGQRLKERGIIPEKTAIEDSNSLLAALEKAAGIAAKMFDQPPLSIQGLRHTIEETKATVVQVKPERLLSFSEIDQLWRQMELAARDQQASIWDVSATISIVALNNIQSVEEGGAVSLEIAGSMYQEQIIDHYWEGLRAIERHGLLATLSRASQPYVEAVWTNYAVDRKTWTEQLMSGELIKWGWSQLSWPKKLTRS
jgi:hypothetical protein